MLIGLMTPWKGSVVTPLFRPPLLLRGWVFFLVVGVAVLTGSAIQIAGMPARYSAQAVIAFVPLSDRPVSAASVMLMVPRYVEYASSPFVVRQAAAVVGVPAPTLQRGLTVTMPATTANVAITVSAPSAVAAAGAANRIAALVIERTGSDPVLAAHLLADAPVPISPGGPSRTLLLAGATAAALALGTLAALAVRWFTRRRYPAGPGMAGVGTAGPTTHYPPITDERLWAREDGLQEDPVLVDTVEMATLDDDDTLDFEPAPKAEAGRKVRS
jgi:capsular polysaccharide biosynthesis protein